MTPKLSTLLATCATAILCTTASAYAAAAITGAQIKNGTVASIDVKNGSLGLADLSQSARAALKSAGPAGAPGAVGAPGPRGVSAWETIPSGQTVVGVFGDASPNDKAGSSALSITLPAAANVPLTHENVNFAFSSIGADTDLSCTGSAQAPTAPAGKVCVYVHSSSGIDAETAFGFAGIASRNGFRLRWNSNPIDQSISGSWAYTAA
jgi:hypothetical protein